MASLSINDSFLVILGKKHYHWLCMNCRFLQIDNRSLSNITLSWSESIVYHTNNSFCRTQLSSAKIKDKEEDIEFQLEKREFDKFEIEVFKFYQSQTLNMQNFTLVIIWASTVRRHETTIKGNTVSRFKSVMSNRKTVLTFRQASANYCECQKKHEKGIFVLFLFLWQR